MKNPPQKAHTCDWNMIYPHNTKEITLKYQNGCKLKQNQITWHNKEILTRERQKKCDVMYVLNRNESTKAGRSKIIDRNDTINSAGKQKAQHCNNLTHIFLCMCDGTASFRWNPKNVNAQAEENSIESLYAR